MSHIIVPDDTFRPWRICKHSRLEVEAAAAEYNQALDECLEVSMLAEELLQPYLWSVSLGGTPNLLTSDVEVPDEVIKVYQLLFVDFPSDTVAMQYSNGTPFPINSWLKTARSMRTMARRLNKLVERAAAKSAA